MCIVNGDNARGYRKRFWRRSCPAGRWSYQVRTVKLFQGQDRSSGGELTKDVPCDGKRYQGYFDQTC